MSGISNDEWKELNKETSNVLHNLINFFADDVGGCLDGSIASCALTATDAIPGGKLAKSLGKIFGKLGKAIDKARNSFAKYQERCNSFVPGTQVMMADGTRKPIEGVEVGDMVLATDPVTGQTEARPVVALITSEGDENLVEITIDTDGPHGDKTGIVIATDNHPLWLEDQAHWFNAKDLRAGMLVRTSAHGDGLAVRKGDHSIPLCRPLR